MNSKTPRIDELRSGARRLHSAVQAGDDDAIARCRSARNPHDPMNRAAALRVVGRELGFRGWAHLMALVRGAEELDPDRPA